MPALPRRAGALIVAVLGNAERAARGLFGLGAVPSPRFTDAAYRTGRGYTTVPTNTEPATAQIPYPARRPP